MNKLCWILLPLDFPQPLLLRRIFPIKGDISTLQKIEHFYFVLTWICLPLDHSHLPQYNALLRNSNNLRFDNCV